MSSLIVDECEARDGVRFREHVFWRVVASEVSDRLMASSCFTCVRFDDVAGLKRGLGEWDLLSSVSNWE